MLSEIVETLQSYTNILYNIETFNIFVNQYLSPKTLYYIFYSIRIETT